MAHDIEERGDDLSPAVRLATSKWLLPILNAKDTSPAFASSFADNITTTCQANGMITVADVAAGLAGLDTADFD